ncbi:unnamed protein product [Vitrella brassicaformis CCMP3155]|uniref:Uncharacterized protein n=1 Tax=Vitrella brassicaformis (strain CCMP3155) TaxID=1169540 RepID=A0A0G4FBF6_VITBC|nr:unnamed protein product [Vitrella brassicaformis CCMP3155]|eukprot:CEM10204.1 unnamed protein product [Vitrella brassicaformis CCMP3155]
MPANEEGEPADPRATASRPPSFTVFLFDYDDTLFPTSAHDNVEEAVREGTMTDEEGRARLAKCAASALRLLERCVLRGQIIICSNGDRSWLAESLDGEAYQELRQFLKARAIPVLSARQHATLQGLIEYDSGVWKRSCFGEILASLRQQGVAPSHALSIGDAEHDLSALERNKEYLQHGGIMTKVQLKDQPTADDLAVQHSVLTTCLDELLEDDQTDNYEMAFEREKGEDGAFVGVSLTAIEDPNMKDPET